MVTGCLRNAAAMKLLLVPRFIHYVSPNVRM